MPATWTKESSLIKTMASANADPSTPVARTGDRRSTDLRDTTGNALKGVSSPLDSPFVSSVPSPICNRPPNHRLTHQVLTGHEGPTSGCSFELR
ncbi:hypothetical protein M407DRAFT_117501 [Tulasnella calospora MUT 4182]|uniref:Uncharacterized protein n=1 Tax=Tulasnella calospora MUT 4182 TaxID=1051891 RepID=A0A0C3LMD1_9AGAM|nr:hypothetical protein M407DRAFT_117501 [Tulasnella calospora MUT 4182]